MTSLSDGWEERERNKFLNQLPYSLAQQTQSLLNTARGCTTFTLVWKLPISSVMQDVHYSPVWTQPHSLKDKHYSLRCIKFELIMFTKEKNSLLLHQSLSMTKLFFISSFIIIFSTWHSFQLYYCRSYCMMKQGHTQKLCHG